MKKDKRFTAERFLNYALEIIYLLTGEEYTVVKKSSGHSSAHQLSREVPIKSDDVAVYFSMEEWEYIEGHKEVYKDVMKETDEAPNTLEIPEHPPPDPVLITEEGAEPRDEKQDIQKVEMCPDSSADLTEPDDEHPEPVSNQEADVTDINDVTWPAVQSEPCADLPAENLDDNSNIEEYEAKAEEKEVVKVVIKSENCADPYEEDIDFVSLIEEEDEEEQEEKYIQKIKIPTSTCAEQLFQSHEFGKCNLLEESHKAVGSLDGLIGDNTSLSQGIQGAPFKTSSSRGKGNSTSIYYQEQATPTTSKSFLAINKDGIEEKMQITSSNCAKIVNPQSDFPLYQAPPRLEKYSLYSGYNKHFSSQTSLHKDHRTYPAVKPNMCHICGKNFSKKSNLVAHQRTHTGEKPYRCSECGKEFAWKSNLEVHKRSHTGEKPYSCNHCGRPFAYKTQLLTHQRSHFRE
ncbi:oocyte zinc finger protein XlCOF7.1 isoform X2 [Bombina bombina]|uniref:oocyte zinc finger protein XlCOF7.1 isoform X2 n=1 Tax=Bombina bombina TaxID=8345 RepID=UPI00235AF422|nr:oocyte zinc finger protein XlCOF7.1 isoform X2 [Bombina bombina]